MAEVEAGNVVNLLVKDMSRMGRDHVQVGMYLEIFRQRGIRFIAIGNSIDSDVPESLEFAPFINIMSEWYARDTSRKVKSIARARGSEGKRLTNAPIYGYVLDPADKTKWLMDEEAAGVVRRIFIMTVEGIGPQQIANALAADKIERGSYYMTKRGIADYSRYAAEESKYDWNTKTITDLIARPEYMGDTVNFRADKQSYKDRNRTKKPKEQWKIFKDTHPAIVDRETWELAQKCRETKRRPYKRTHTDANPLTGLMFCADCGKKMYNHREEKSESKTVYHKDTQERSFDTLEGAAKNKSSGAAPIMGAGIGLGMGLGMGGNFGDAFGDMGKKISTSPDKECPNCHKQIGLEYSFCPFCGKDTNVDVNQTICPKCGSKNRTGLKFCGECGNALIKTCPKCGEALAVVSNLAFHTRYSFLTLVR